MDKTFAVKNLKLVADTIPAVFLSNGSLLGAIREGDVIGHDLDTDLGLFIEHWYEDLVKDVEKLGFELYKTYGTVENGLEYTFTKDNIHLDIFFYYPEPTGCWHAVYKGGEQRRYHFPHPQGFTTVKLGGVTFNAPQKGLDFLEAQYGNWKIPVEGWDYWTSPLNIYER